MGPCYKRQEKLSVSLCVFRAPFNEEYMSACFCVLASDDEVDWLGDALLLYDAEKFLGA
jgi:hypothetical protein